MCLWGNVALLLIAVTLQIEYTENTLQSLPKNPFERYSSNFGKRKSLTKAFQKKPTDYENNNNNAYEKHLNGPVYKAYDFLEVDFPRDTSPYNPFNLNSGSICPIQASLDKKYDSALIDNYKKEARRKRKSKRLANKDIQEKSLLEINPVSQLNYVTDIAFPEVEYPLSAMETWKPMYWNAMSYQINNDVSKHDDYATLQNKKQKEVNSFIKPSRIKNNKQIAVVKKPKEKISKLTTSNTTDAKNAKIIAAPENETLNKLNDPLEPATVSHNSLPSTQIRQKSKKLAKTPASRRKQNTRKKVLSNSTKSLLPLEQSATKNKLTCFDDESINNSSNCLNITDKTPDALSSSPLSEVNEPILLPMSLSSDQVDNIDSPFTNTFDQCASHMICDTQLPKLAPDTILNNITHESLIEAIELNQNIPDTSTSAYILSHDDKTDLFMDAFTPGKDTDSIDFTTTIPSHANWDTTVIASLPIPGEPELIMITEPINTVLSVSNVSPHKIDLNSVKGVTSSSTPFTNDNIKSTDQFTTLNPLYNIQEKINILDDGLPDKAHKFEAQVPILSTTELRDLAEIILAQIGTVPIDFRPDEVLAYRAGTLPTEFIIPDSSIANLIDIAQRGNVISNYVTELVLKHVIQNVMNSETLDKISSTDQKLLTTGTMITNSLSSDTLTDKNALPEFESLSNSYVPGNKATLDQWPKQKYDIAASVKYEGNTDPNKSSAPNLQILKVKSGKYTVVPNSENGLTEIIPNHVETLIPARVISDLSEVRDIVESILAQVGSLPKKLIPEYITDKAQHIPDKFNNDKDPILTNPVIPSSPQRDDISELNVIVPTSYAVSDHQKFRDSNFKEELFSGGLVFGHLDRELELASVTQSDSQYLSANNTKSNVLKTLSDQTISTPLNLSGNIMVISNNITSHNASLSNIYSDAVSLPGQNLDVPLPIELYCPLSTFDQCSIYDQPESVILSNYTETQSENLTLMDLISGKYMDNISNISENSLKGDMTLEKQSFEDKINCTIGKAFIDKNAYTMTCNHDSFSDLLNSSTFSDAMKNETMDNILDNDLLSTAVINSVLSNKTNNDILLDLPENDIIINTETLDTDTMSNNDTLKDILCNSTISDTLEYDTLTDIPGNDTAPDNSDNDNNTLHETPSIVSLSDTPDILSNMEDVDPLQQIPNDNSLSIITEIPDDNTLQDMPNTGESYFPAADMSRPITDNDNDNFLSNIYTVQIMNGTNAEPDMIDEVQYPLDTNLSNIELLIIDTLPDSFNIDEVKETLYISEIKNKPNSDGVPDASDAIIDESDMNALSDQPISDVKPNIPYIDAASGKTSIYVVPEMPDIYGTLHRLGTDPASETFDMNTVPDKPSSDEVPNIVGKDMTADKRTTDKVLDKPEIYVAPDKPSTYAKPDVPDEDAVPDEADTGVVPDMPDTIDVQDNTNTKILSDILLTDMVTILDKVSVQDNPNIFVLSNSDLDALPIKSSKNSVPNMPDIVTVPDKINMTNTEAAPDNSSIDTVLDMADTDRTADTDAPQYKPGTDTLPAMSNTNTVQDTTKIDNSSNELDTDAEPSGSDEILDQPDSSIVQNDPILDTVDNHAEAEKPVTNTVVDKSDTDSIFDVTDMDAVTDIPDSDIIEGTLETDAKTNILDPNFFPVVDNTDSFLGMIDNKLLLDETNTRILSNDLDADVLPGVTDDDTLPDMTDNDPLPIIWNHFH